MNARIIGGDEQRSNADLASGLQVQDGPCRVYDVTAYNATGGDLWLMLVDLPAFPTIDGDIPAVRIKVSADNQNSFSYAGGRPFISGCQAVWSSTVDAVTLVSNAGYVDAVYTRQ